jgi:hypothetical protein
MRMADYRLVLAGISCRGSKHRDHARLETGHLQGAIPELVGSPVRVPLAGIPVEPREWHAVVSMQAGSGRCGLQPCFTGVIPITASLRRPHRHPAAAVATGIPGLARISHRAALENRMPLQPLKFVLNMQITVCFIEMPIPALAGSRAPGLALLSSGSYGYHFRSRAASSHTNPAPASGIPVRNAG